MKPWTTTELRVLRLFATLGTNGVATILERSSASVAQMAKQEGISLKRTDEDIDITNEVLTLLAKVADTPNLSICPMCGKRWATMKETGMCRPCHLDRLLSLYQEKAEIEIRQKALTAARQDKRRKTRCENCGGSL